MKLETSIPKVETNHKQLQNCKTTLNSMPNNFRKLSRMLSIPGNEIRLKILFLLNLEEELSTTDLAEILEVSAATASQHISKIKSLGIISARKEGQFLYYSLNEDKSTIFNSVFDSFKLDIKNT